MAFKEYDRKPTFLDMEIQTVDEYSRVDSKKFTFKSIGEAIELIKFYLEKPTLRHEMANMQYEYFVQNHTYEHRVKQILETVGFNGALTKNSN